MVPKNKEHGMSNKKPDYVAVLDKSSRRRFILAGSGILMAGALSQNALASDCDQGGEARTDQDSGESADPKGCQPKNIVSQNQPERKTPIVVKTIKA
ncbi:MAG: hypothetical protein ACI8UP_003786 [Porticoccaceae bacterium]|jgi:hypothetical protein